MNHLWHIKAVKVMAARIDSIILGQVQDFLSEKEARARLELDDFSPDPNPSEETRIALEFLNRKGDRDENGVPYSTDAEGKSWHDRPRLL